MNSSIIINKEVKYTLTITEREHELRSKLCLFKDKRTRYRSNACCQRKEASLC